MGVKILEMDNSVRNETIAKVRRARALTCARARKNKMILGNEIT
jgi:hypothetical protein